MPTEFDVAAVMLAMDWPLYKGFEHLAVEDQARVLRLAELIADARASAAAAEREKYVQADRPDATDAVWDPESQTLFWPSETTDDVMPCPRCASPLPGRCLREACPQTDLSTQQE